MKCVLKKVGMKAEVVDIENRLEALQEAVGGYIEVITVLPQRKGLSGTVIIVNEEGRLKKLLPNFVYGGERLMGDALIVSTRGDAFCDMDDSYAAAVADAFNSGAVMQFDAPEKISRKGSLEATKE